MENLTPKFTFAPCFQEHQMAHNGEFLQLSLLQMMQQQTIDSSEDVAFGDRKLQLRPHFADALLAVGMWANKLAFLGLQFPNV